MTQIGKARRFWNRPALCGKPNSGKTFYSTILPTLTVIVVETLLFTCDAQAADQHLYRPGLITSGTAFFGVGGLLLLLLGGLFSLRQKKPSEDANGLKLFATETAIVPDRKPRTAEARHKMSGNNQQSLFEATPLPTLVCDAKSLAILAVNGA